MDWRRLEFVTRAGLVATVVAVVSLLVPPVSVAAAVVGAGFSGAAVFRARSRGERDPVAMICLGVSVSLLIVVVVGSLLYAAGNPEPDREGAGSVVLIAGTGR